MGLRRADGRTPSCPPVRPASPRGPPTARRWRPSGSKPSWARCCLSVSCWTPRSPPWRPTALWPAGGRDDEPDPLALKRPALWPGPCVPGLARIARHHLPPSFLSARTAAASGPGWADAGCRAGRGDPRGSDRQPVSRRGAPEGLGPAARRRRSHVQASRPAAHAREQLLAPSRVGAPRGPRNHDGTIIPDTVDTMWGTDLTTTITGEGQVAVFVAFDHYSAECVGIHAARRAPRFEALEPIRQGVRRCFGAFAKEIARGLAVRHDHGSQYMSDAFQKELAFLGIESSPAFVRAPEGNGCAERFIRTLKENLLWVRTFDTVEELRQALLVFREVYNTTWLIERHGFQTPAAMRQSQLSSAARAA